MTLNTFFSLDFFSRCSENDRRITTTTNTENETKIEWEGERRKRRKKNRNKNFRLKNYCWILPIIVRNYCIDSIKFVSLDTSGKPNGFHWRWCFSLTLISVIFLIFLPLLSFFCCSVSYAFYQLSRFVLYDFEAHTYTYILNRRKTTMLNI